MKLKFLLMSYMSFLVLRFENELNKNWPKILDRYLNKLKYSLYKLILFTTIRILSLVFFKIDFENHVEP